MHGYRITRDMAEIGEHMRGWRLVLGLTAQQVAERGGMSRDTLRKVEVGDPTVSFGAVAQVWRALGQLDTVREALDPLNSDVGRLRADRLHRKRAR